MNPPSTPAAPVSEARRWLSFEHDGDTWMFDQTFLTSSWTCIFGRGCPGVLEEAAPELEHGCCTHGAHFTDKADRKRVTRLAEELTAEQWQLKDVAAELGGPIHRNEHKEWVTRVVDGACVFLNRPDHPTGSGCALHQVALQRGERPIDWKPEVCWQLPLRLHHHVDDGGHATWTLRAWLRRDWGEGGFDFHWWCTDHVGEGLAYVGHQPVYRELAEDIRELIGAERYELLVAHLEAAPADGQPVAAPRTRRRR